MGLREWIPSKEITQTTVELLADLLRETGLPDLLLGFGVLWFHVVGGVLLVLCLLFFPINTSFFFLCVFVWNCVLFSNYYFHGCILSRLERELFHLNSWYGPVSLMNALKVITKDIANLVIKFCFAIPVSVLLLFRFVWNRDTLGLLWPLLLGLFYMPFVFARSQKVIFTGLFEAVADWMDENWDEALE